MIRLSQLSQTEHLSLHYVRPEVTGRPYKIQLDGRERLVCAPATRGSQVLLLRPLGGVG